MGHVTEVIRTVLPVLLMIAIGTLCRRTGLVSREGINTLKNVVVNITLPAVLLNAFATTTYTVLDVIIPLLMFLVCVLAWYLGKAGAKLLNLSSRFVPFLTTGFEAGMLGYALFAMLCGDSRTAEFARIDLGQVLFVFTLYKLLLGLDTEDNRGKDNRTGLRQLLKEMIISPIIIAIAAGVIIGASGLYQALAPAGISSIFDACTSFVSAPTGAIILLTIGYDLELRSIPWAAVSRVVLLRLAIMLVLGAGFIGILSLLMPGQVPVTAVCVMFILPPPFVLPVFADDADQRVYVSSALSAFTLVAIAGFAVIAALGV